MPKKVNELRATKAFDQALACHSQEFECFFLSRFLGLGFSYVENRCVVEMHVEDFMLNPQGTLHGGVIATVMDISMGHLLNHLYGPGATLEMKTQFLHPIAAGQIKVVGSLLKSGRATHFLRSELYDAADELCAFATSTWRVGTRHPSPQ